MEDLFLTRKLHQVCLLVSGISLTSGQLINELFPVLCYRGGDRLYEMRFPFVAVGLECLLYSAASLVEHATGPYGILHTHRALAQDPTGWSVS